ncbi:hypothetical protein GW17_00046104 [Ensete ventricosum]|nr:hypothetical protein GW17_00046104 [Ensete ventricosum]
METYTPLGCHQHQVDDTSTEPHLHAINATRASYLCADLTWHVDRGKVKRTIPTAYDHPFRAMEDFYTDSVISVGEAIGNVPKDVQAMEDFYTDSVITSS